MIRTATDHDAHAVAALERGNLGIDAWSEGLVAEAVGGRLPTIHVLVAEVDGAVVGHAVASIVVDVAELQRIAVTAAHRRTGLASELLAAVVALAAEGGAESLLLEVREDNAGALAFYAERGFTEIARRRRYYNDGATAAVLKKSVGPGDAAVDQV